MYGLITEVNMTDSIIRLTNSISNELKRLNKQALKRSEASVKRILNKYHKEVNSIIIREIAIWESSSKKMHSEELKNE